MKVVGRFFGLGQNESKGICITPDMNPKLRVDNYELTRIGC